MSSHWAKPAAAYVRMSTEHQRYSIANQMAAIETFCEVNNLALGRIYSDAGRSGLTIAGRPGLAALIEDARRGSLPFEAVVVLDVSRWGRFQNTDEAAWLEHLMTRAGAAVLYCAEPFDNDGSSGSGMVKAIKRAMAAEFSRELSRKVAAGGRRVAASGWRPGSVAGYGYRRVIVTDEGRVIQHAEYGDRKALFNGRTTLELGPLEEVRAVRRVFHLYTRRHLTMKKIAAALVAEEWPAPAPRTFCAGWVSCILSNEKYAGTLVYGKTVNHLRTGVTRTPADEWTVYENAHPAIVSLAQFKAAQAERKRRQRRYSREDLVRVLKAIHTKYGVVSTSLIRSSDRIPSIGKFVEAFGSLSSAYIAAELPTITLAERRAAVRALQNRSRAELDVVHR